MHRARRAKAALAPPAALRRAAETYISPVAAPEDAQTTQAPRARPCRLPAVTGTGPLPKPIAGTPHLHGPGRVAAGIAAPGPVPQPGSRRLRGGPGAATPRGWPPRFPRARNFP